MSTAIKLEPMLLAPLGGPPVQPVQAQEDRPTVIGRASGCDVRLESPMVSRRHASLSQAAGRWLLTDLGSKHGTHVNGVRLEPNAPTPLAWGDHVSMGPWTFRVEIGSRHGSTINSVDDTGQSPQIRTLHAAGMESLAASRLKLLMDSAERLHAAPDEATLTQEVVNAVLAGTGFSRAAVVRMLGGQRGVELLASARRDGSGAGREGELAISRSLLAAALSGEVVQLETRPSLREAMSIVGAGVAEAICAPVLVGPAVDAFVYADCELKASGPDSGAAAFVSALSRICGLALAGLKRLALERQQRELMRELHSAREVQRRIMPAEGGRVGPVRFACHSKAGRVVAGDLCGVVELPGEGGTRGAVFIGDVVGKGLGPALLMASAQAFLNSALRWSDEPSRVVAGANDYLSMHAGSGEFASLWLAVVEPRGRVRCVDAGHGLAAVVRGGGRAERLHAEGGVPLGVSGGMTYGCTELALSAGDRMVLFTDGLAEQQSAEGEEFGFGRVLAALQGSAGVEEDVRRLVEALRAFAGEEQYADDVTIASFELVPA